MIVIIMRNLFSFFLYHRNQLSNRYQDEMMMQCGALFLEKGGQNWWTYKYDSDLTYEVISLKVS